MPVVTDRMFDNKNKMLKRLKKKTYEENFAWFQAEYAEQFEEITAYAEQAADKQSAVTEIGTWFTDGVYGKYASGKKKIPSYVRSESVYDLLCLSCIIKDGTSGCGTDCGRDL